VIVARSRLIVVLALTFLMGASMPQALAQKAKCRGMKATVVGTAGNDSLLGTKKADVIAALGGDDFVFGKGGNDIICGGGGSDGLNGMGGADQIFGEGGSDYLYPGPGNDRVNGGAENDSVAHLFSTTPVKIDLPAQRVTGEGTDKLVSIEGAIGSEFDDLIIGTDAGNTVDALGGNDTIVGGGDVDVLEGGPGDDSIDGGDGLDAISHFSAQNAVQVDLSAGTVTGEGTDSIVSIEAVGDGPGDDTIVGNDDMNMFIMWLGNDRIEARGGVYLILSWFAQEETNIDLDRGTATGMGNDSFVDVEGAWGSLIAPNRLTGNDADNILFGGFVNDQIFGGDGNDGMQGFTGDDLFDGGDGTYDLASFLDGSAGVNADLDSGAVTGPLGNDTLIDIESIEGTEFADILIGDSAINFLYGFGGDDQLEGGSGDDFIGGGPGNDTSDGGTGEDNCWLAEILTGCEGTAPAPDHPLEEPEEVLAQFKLNF